MRLNFDSFLVGIIIIPLLFTTAVSHGGDLYLPTLENFEAHIDNLWINFKKTFDIVYNTTTEEFYRFKIFTHHIKLIIKHNLEYDLGLHTFRLGINKYATLVYSLIIKTESFVIYSCLSFYRQTKNFVKN